MLCKKGVSIILHAAMSFIKSQKGKVAEVQYSIFNIVFDCLRGGGNYLCRFIYAFPIFGFNFSRHKSNFLRTYTCKFFEAGLVLSIQGTSWCSYQNFAVGKLLKPF